MSKEDIEKLDKQIELLKKDKNNMPTGEVETVTTEINDPNDENHVINISYIDSEVKETTKEIKDLKVLTENELNNDLEDTKKIIVENIEEIKEEKEDNNNISDLDKGIDNNTKNTTIDKRVFIVLGIIIGILVIVLISCIFIFNGNDKDKTPIVDDSESDKVLSKDLMIKTVDLYGKSLEIEINKFYNENNKLPNFSTVNNLVNLDYEVVCHIHEIYEDKTIYLDECMVEYNDIDHSYGVQKEIKVEVVDNNNVKVYVNKKTKNATLDVPANLDDYYLYSSNIDSEISNIYLLGNTSYLTYLDENTKTFELYNYVVGKKGFYNVDYVSYSTVRLFSKNMNTSNYNPEYSSEYVILHFKDSSSKIYSLITGEPVGEKYNTIAAYEVASNKLVVGMNNKYGVLNIKTNKLEIPIEYDRINNSGNSILAIQGVEVSIFDEDGNKYLEDDLHITNLAAVYDKYVLDNHKLYNLNGKVVCKFDSDINYTIKNNRFVKDKLIYVVSEKNTEKCYIYDFNEKDCTIVEETECSKIY